MHVMQYTSPQMSANALCRPGKNRFEISPSHRRAELLSFSLSLRLQSALWARIRILKNSVLGEGMKVVYKKVSRPCRVVPHYIYATGGGAQKEMIAATVVRPGFVSWCRLRVSSDKCIELQAVELLLSLFKSCACRPRGRTSSTGPRPLACRPASASCHRWPS